jgi:hypothetical protein
VAASAAMDQMASVARVEHDEGSGPFARVAEHAEALQVLTAEAARHRTGVDPAFLAGHALKVTAGGDFAVAQGALDALVRRAAAAGKDDLDLLATPRGKDPRGTYRVGRRGARERQYEVWLDGAAPLAGSCSCPDYGKAALGLCKHLFRVAAAAQKRRSTGRRLASAPRLRWDPIRPLTGAGDWLERLAWDADGPVSDDDRGVRALFAAGRSGWQPLRNARASDRGRRLAMIEALLTWLAGPGRGGAEPAVPALLRREREQLRHASARGVPAREATALLAGMKRKLFPYQRDGVKRFLEAGRLLLADDMGLGKTAQAIAACHVLTSSGRARRALIVVPAALKSQWQREWAQFTDVAITLVEGSPAERAAIYRRPPSAVLLVNYEQVVRDLPALVAFGPDLVVLDEAQRIKNWETKTATYVKRLEAPWRLVLTGTPMENRLDELASILEWVDDHALEPRWRLPVWHATHADGPRDVVGARNLDTLRMRLAPSLLRRVRHEVLEQLPPRRDVRVPVPLTDAQQALHDDYDQPIVQLMAKAKRRPLTQAEFLRLMSMFTQQRILCNGIAQRDFEAVWPDLEGRQPTEALLATLHSPKLLELREIVKGVLDGAGRKVVIFSQWRRMLRLAAWAVSDLVATAGARAVFFTGQESQKRRTQNVVDFHDDPATRILFASDAGGVGLNLQRAASACINLDLPWNPAVLEQRIGRIYRLGQELPVEVYNLVAESGIESRIASIVADKRALFSGLFDGSSDSVVFDRGGSFLARLEALVQAPALPPLPERDDPDDAVECAVDDATDSTGPDEAPIAAPATLDVAPASVAALLGQLTVSTTADGRLSVSAPAPAAAALGALLRGLADALTVAPSPR